MTLQTLNHTACVFRGPRFYCLPHRSLNNAIKLLVYFHFCEISIALAQTRLITVCYQKMSNYPQSPPRAGTVVFVGSYLGKTAKTGWKRVWKTRSLKKITHQHTSRSLLSIEFNRLCGSDLLPSFRGYW